MLNKIRNRQRGFTLIELLIVVAIIGIIAALLIPNFLDALQKAKQKRSVADMRNLGTAFMSFLTDMASAAAAGSTSTDTYDVTANGMAISDAGRISELLVTRYIQQVPLLDGWKFPYEYYLGSSVSAPQVFAIRSSGRDASFDGPAYDVTAFTPTDYDQDLVWADGFFVRWPQNFKQIKLQK